MPPHRLHLLPSDVLFYVFHYCDLDTHAILPLVCSSLNTLAQERGYWINALRNAQLQKPIACPLHEDLTKASLADLRNIALHTLRLERNWSSPFPEVKGIVNEVALGNGRPDVIFQVPGRDLYLMHSRKTGGIAAWNIKLGVQVTPEYYMARYVRDVSPGQDEPGCFSMGLLTAEDKFGGTANKLFVIRLEYNEHDEVDLCIKYITQFEPNRAQWAAFMTKEIVGVLDNSYAIDDLAVHILAYNMRTRKAVNIVTDLLRKDVVENSGQSATSLTSGDLLILIEAKGKSSVYTCARNFLPHDDNLNCPVSATVKLKDTCLITNWSSVADTHRVLPEGCLSSDDLHGVPAVSIIRYERENDSDSVISGLHVRFWSPPPLLECPWSTLVPAHIVDIPGRLHESTSASWSLLLIPCSGLRVLLILDTNDQVSLKLISYHPETNDSTVSELDVSLHVDIRGVYNIAMDDHRGILSLLHVSGHLYAIPYA
ncbi:hypothetical protein D9619_001669 [Psilocybe cf. subviscida]|uniref:F-box domain-containing protein n=1 Tax=Psilocybe cf. subviscida TaxID=2480587 RepID=A0A8H5BD58_9AGAR|nr:hypothetical protein D9619_001669 [Psilocybe cf. subviscida]